jgi:hypothetical protein
MSGRLLPASGISQTARVQHYLGRNLCPFLVKSQLAMQAQIMLNTHIVIRQSKKHNGRTAAVQ